MPNCELQIKNCKIRNQGLQTSFYTHQKHKSFVEFFISSDKMTEPENCRKRKRTDSDDTVFVINEQSQSKPRQVTFGIYKR